MRPLDRSKSLDELDPPAWKDSGVASSLVATCHQLRRKPIGEFSTEDLRIMIGQSIGLRWLVPLALELIKEHPLAEGDFYPGDLLNSVLRVESDFWDREWEWRKEVEDVVTGLPDLPVELEENVARFLGARHN
jgi:hypothetical protein